MRDFNPVERAGDQIVCCSLMMISFLSFSFAIILKLADLVVEGFLGGWFIGPTSSTEARQEIFSQEIKPRQKKRCSLAFIMAMTRKVIGHFALTSANCKYYLQLQSHFSFTLFPVRQLPSGLHTYKACS